MVTLANGTWTTTRQLPPTLSYIDYHAVSCTSATTCTAVGAYESDRAGDEQAIVATLSGGTWTQFGLPQYDFGIVQMYGVSCSTATACTSAGLAGRLGSANVPLSETRTS